MRRSNPIGAVSWMAGFVAVLAGSMALVLPSNVAAQSTTSTQPVQSTPQSDNPFPGEPAAEPKRDGGQKPDGNSVAKPGQAPASAGKTTSDNPFPGEDTNAPIIPVDPGPVSDGGRRPDAAADPDGDPMRSPDGPGNAGGDSSDTDGFSSSRSGVKASPDENETDAKPGKSVKVKTREEVLKEDIDVGSFYLDKKNWKGAQDRFASAFKLDPEDENAVFGLAEAEQHLELYDKAREHYELFLSYDPDGPHSKVARKALEQVEAAQSKTVGAAHTGASKSGPN